MKLYLAGPMTGIPQFNFPAFHAAATSLRAKGHVVISPAEEDPPEVQAAVMQSEDGKLDAHGMVGSHTWGDLLARDIKIVADAVDGIVLLPGWAASRGARLEAFTAILCGKPLYLYDDGEVLWYSPIFALAAINHFTTEAIYGIAGH